MLWTRIFAVWLGIAVLMILHGALREALATPALGELRAHQLSSVTGSLLVLTVAWLTLPWLGASGSPSLQLAIGLTWLATTILFEFGFGHWVAGHSWARLLRDYNVLAARLWVLVLLTTLLGPWLAGRLRDFFSTGATQ